MHPARIALGLVLLALLPAPNAFARQHAPATPATRTASAQRYATDATLRAQMREIRANVITLERARPGHVTPELAGQIADRISGHVNTIIVNCKLPADADNALHEIIGPLLEAASALKSDPGRTDGIAGMRRSLDQYARQFDDPAFPRGAD